MMILWEEYREINQDGYGYSRYVAVGVMWRKPEKWPVSLARTAT
jgi:hypothetical protein